MIDIKFRYRFEYFHLVRKKIMFKIIYAKFYFIYNI
jgi:hypothetical protein